MKLPAIIRWAALPAAMLYTAVVWLRHKAFDIGLLKVGRLPRPVISVGNIQLGGTGKTPFTIYLARHLEERGKSIAVLTRGYRRKGKSMLIITAQARQTHTVDEIGDEPFLILQNTRKVILGVGADRLEIGMRILQNHPVDLFLLDDGMQHRRLHRDVNICLIDVSRWSTAPWLFPFSQFRDIPAALKHTDAIILTKYQDSLPRLPRIEAYLIGKFSVPIFRGDLAPVELSDMVTGEKFPLSWLMGKKVLAFCGIANPEDFFATVSGLGGEIVERKTFMDHHRYRFADVEQLHRQAKSRQADVLITTEKDAVKLLELLKQQQWDIPFMALRVHFQLETEGEFWNWLGNFLPFV